jgi:hypothetical protein
MTIETLNMVAGLLGGLILGSIAACFAAAAAYVVTWAIIGIRDMWRE